MVTLQQSFIPGIEYLENLSLIRVLDCPELSMVLETTEAISCAVLSGSQVLLWLWLWFYAETNTTSKMAAMNPPQL